MELFVSESALLAGFARTSRLTFPNQSGSVGVGSSKMPIEAVVADGKLTAGEPFCKRLLPFQDFFPRPEPDQFVLRLLCPEFFGRPDGLVIELPILGDGFDMGSF